MQYNSFNCIHIVVQKISRTFSSCGIETLDSLNDSSPFFTAPNYYHSKSLTPLNISYKWNHKNHFLFETV